MRTILARHLTGDHTEREIEVLNAAKLGQWRRGMLEAVIHYANKTVLAVYWDDSGTLEEWAIRKGDAALHVRIPDLPAPIPDEARSAPEEHVLREASWARARFIGGAS